MAYSFQFLDAAGSAEAEGIFIPRASLPGIQAGEIDSEQSPAIKDGKVLLAIIVRCFKTMSSETFPKLGLSLVRSPYEGVESNTVQIFNQTFSITYQKMVRLETNSLEQIPTPTSGANLGKGRFGILDIFPGASKVASGDSLSGAGVVIKTSSLTPYTNLTHAGLTVSATADNREWFQALWNHLALDAPVRTSSVESAIVAASASSFSGQAIPNAFTASTDPLSGIAASDRPRRGLISRTLSWTIQLSGDDSSQSFDVYVA